MADVTDKEPEAPKSAAEVGSLAIPEWWSSVDFLHPAEQESLRGTSPILHGTASRLMLARLSSDFCALLQADQDRAETAGRGSSQFDSKAPFLSGSCDCPVW